MNGLGTLPKIAYAWSEQGTDKMARIILERMTTASQCKQCTKERLRLDDNVVIVLCGVKAAQ